MTNAAAALRQQVEGAVLRQMEADGPSAFDRGPIVREFGGQVPRSTLFRWIGATLNSGKPGRHLAEVIKVAAEERAARTPDPVADLVGSAAATLPAPIRVDDIVASPNGVVGVVSMLNECIVTARQVMAHARSPDGAVRMSKTLLLASEHLRRSLETAVKLQEAIRGAEAFDRFAHSILATFRQVAEEHPELGELIYRRLMAVAREFDLPESQATA